MKYDKRVSASEATKEYLLRLSVDPHPNSSMAYGLVEKDHETRNISMELTNLLANMPDEGHIPGSTFSKRDVYNPEDSECNQKFFQIVSLLKKGTIRPFWEE